MPASFNGIGTRYYGQSDHRADGSFITSEWFSICFVPVVPLASYRLLHLTGKDVNWGFYNSEQYQVMEKLPLHWGLVGWVYLFALIYGLWLSCLVWLLYFQFDDRFDENSWLRLGLLILGAWVPFGITSFLRRRRLAQTRAGMAKQ